MKIQFNFSNKVFYTLIAVVIVGILGFGAYAIVNTNAAWHPTSQVSINAINDDLATKLSQIDIAIANLQSQGSSWPAGNYCIIQKQGQTCPTGFAQVNPNDGDPGECIGVLYGGAASKDSADTLSVKRSGSSSGSYKCTEWAWCCK